MDESILTKLNHKDTEILKLKYNGPESFGLLDNSGKQELAIVLNRLCYFVGIKEPLSVDNLKMLISYLVRYHSNFNILELENAVMMACAGEFGHVEHYQSFSSIYISKVLNLYNSYRAEIIHKYTTELNKQTQADKLATKEKEYDKVKGFTDTVLSQYDYYIKSKNDEFNSDNISIGNTRASICIELGQKLGLFLDYKKHKETALEFFQRVFKPLVDKEVDAAKEIISSWIQKNSKKY